MSGRYPDSSPLLGDRHGLNEPIVRVGTSAAARQLPINEAAAAYSFSQRYPRLAKVVRERPVLDFQWNLVQFTLAVPLDDVADTTPCGAIGCLACTCHDE